MERWCASPSNPFVLAELWLLFRHLALLGEGTDVMWTRLLPSHSLTCLIKTPSSRNNFLDLSAVLDSWSPYLILLPKRTQISCRSTCLGLSNSSFPMAGIIFLIFFFFNFLYEDYTYIWIGALWNQGRRFARLSTMYTSPGWINGLVFHNLHLKINVVFLPYVWHREYYIKKI